MAPESLNESCCDACTLKKLEWRVRRLEAIISASTEKKVFISKIKARGSRVKFPNHKGKLYGE